MTQKKYYLVYDTQKNHKIIIPKNKLSKNHVILFMGSYDQCYNNDHKPLVKNKL